MSRTEACAGAGTGQWGWGISSLQAWAEGGIGSNSPYLAALAAAAGDTPGEMGRMSAEEYLLPPQVMSPS